MRNFDSSRERGTSIVECTIIMPFLLFFAIFTLDVFRIAYEQLALTYVLTTEKRELLIHTSSDPTEIRTRFSRQLARFGVGLTSSDTVTVCPLANFNTTCETGSIIPPVGNELVVFRIEKGVQSALFSGLHRLGTRGIVISAMGVGRSEPR